jgi:hypothetical protein
VCGNRGPLWFIFMQLSFIIAKFNETKREWGAFAGIRLIGRVYGRGVLIIAPKTSKSNSRIIEINDFYCGKMGSDAA